MHHAQNLCWYSWNIELELILHFDVYVNKNSIWQSIQYRTYL